MQVQYLTNEKGEKTGVMVSIKQWNTLQKKLKKYQFLENLRKSVEEVNLIRAGKLKSISTEELLSQLK